MVKGGSVKGGRVGRINAREALYVEKPSNVSLLGYLMTGCFYKDDSSFCANRFTDYNCLYWIANPKLSPQLSKYNKLMLSKLKNTTHVAELGRQVDLKHCVDTSDATTMEIATVILPILLTVFTFLGVIHFGFLLHMVRKLKFDFCIYALIVNNVGLLICVFRLINFLVYPFLGVHLTDILLLMDNSYCQLTTMTFSFLIHFQSVLRAVYYIENSRICLRPIKTLTNYKLEHVFNATIVTLTVTLIINIQYLWTFSINQTTAEIRHMSTTGYVCQFADRVHVGSAYQFFVWPIVDLLLADVVPLVAVVGYIVAVISTRQQRLLETPKLHTVTMNHRCLIQLQTALVCAGFGHVITALPYALLALFKYIKDLAKNANEWSIYSASGSQDLISLTANMASVAQEKQILRPTPSTHENLETLLVILFQIPGVLEVGFFAILVQEYRTFFWHYVAKLNVCVRRFTNTRCRRRIRESTFFAPQQRCVNSPNLIYKRIDPDIDNVI